MTELKIKGMSCGHCESAVASALSEVAGVEKVRVNLTDGTAQVEGNAELSALVAAVESEGYEAAPAASQG